MTAATIYLSLLGPEGLRNVASACHARTRDLVAALDRPRRFDSPYFHECVLRLGQPARPVVEALAAQGILGGLALGPYFSDLADCLLVCATEKRTARDIRQFADSLDDAVRKAA